MNKKNVINTPATHSVSSDSSSARRKTEVSAQITLSDSILTGAIVEYRKAGYNLQVITLFDICIRTLKSIGYFPENAIWIFNRRPFIARKVILL